MVEVDFHFLSLVCFRYSLHLNTVYGSELSDGSWSGMVGEVQRQEYDMAVAGLTVTPQRETVIDFTYPYWFKSIGLLIKVC